MAITFRNVADDEVELFRDAMFSVFGNDPSEDPNSYLRLRALIAPEQRWAACDGDAIVGTAGTLPLEVGIPGGTLPMAGLSIVTVRSTHRRRGILRQLMQLHIDDAERRGFAISGLWASEASIYGRFGYGMAAEADVVTVRNASTLGLDIRELDAVDYADDKRAREALPAIYARATASRPGAIVRSPLWWRERRFLEAPFQRQGASARRHVLARRGSELVGYLQYRQRPDWQAGLPTGTIEIIELLAIDARASATLWRFAFDIDLYPTVKWWAAPTDDPLAWFARDARRVERHRVDNLWLRVGDIPRALEARRYQADGTLRVRVDDATYELAVTDGHGRCTPATREPELVMSRQTLSALYLGGVTASRLAHAGRVVGDAAAILRADRMLAWSVAPWCAEVF